jgi:gamma-glutamyltranspeptidase/glutathione hydrolase
LHDGDRLTQVDLAATLSTIADQGPRGFYEGPVAENWQRRSAMPAAS